MTQYTACPHCGGELVGEEKAGAPPYECESCGWKIGDIATAISWEEFADHVAGWIGRGPLKKRAEPYHEVQQLDRLTKAAGGDTLRGQIAGLALFARLMAVVMS
jgi:hypothetical protein